MRNGLSLFSSYVRHLNAEAVERDVDALVPWAVDALSDVLGFDSAWYGWAEIGEDDVTIHASATRNLPGDYFAFWTSIASEDILAGDIRAAPAEVATYDRNAGRQTDGMQTLADQFGLRRLATAMHRRKARSASLFLSAYRGGANSRPWSVEEREFLRCAVDQISLAALRRSALFSAADHASVFVSEDGVAIAGLRSMWDRFGHIWSSLDGDRVPAALSAFVDEPGEHILVDRQLVVTCEPSLSPEGFSLRKLSIRPLARFDLLAPRERQVALALASGKSHKESARALGVAPSTIRNQTQAIYQKLGVDNRASLAAAVSRSTGRR
ncbi:MAG: LuxR C-terminal-related transcriptional regulator [Pseudomonadota bacterium]